MASSLVRRKRRLIATLVAVNLLFPVIIIGWGLFVESDADRGVESLVSGEQNAITWFSSVQLLAIALVAYGIHFTNGLVRSGGGRSVAHAWIWPLLSMAFAFLAFDEFFMFHERLREDVLIPNRLFTSSEWLKPGDIGMLIYLAAGLVVLSYVILSFGSDRFSTGLFLLGLAIIAPLVWIDSVWVGVIYDNEAALSAFHVVEEIGENIAELCFLVAFVRFLFGRIDELSARLPRQAAA